MCEDSKKVYCLVIGKNETAVLKTLAKKKDYILESELYKIHKDNISLSYPIQLETLLSRLKEKGLVEWIYNEDESDGLIKIKEKGTLLLKLLKLK